MRAKKSFGQHFLKDQGVLARTVEAAEIRAEDIVVEIGPGNGALTDYLSSLPNELHLFEADQELFPALKEHYPGATLHEGDAAQADFSHLFPEGKPWVVVANLPYNAGNAIIMQLLTALHPPRRLVVMVQKEVGERMRYQDSAARGVFGLAVQCYAEVSMLEVVPPGAFVPPPKVDSAVMILTPRPLSAPERALREQMLALAKTAFLHRRKQLASTLAGAHVAPKDALQRAFIDLGHPATARPESLTLADWLNLYTKVRQNAGSA